MCPVSRAEKQRVRKTHRGRAGSTLRGGPCRSGVEVCVDRAECFALGGGVRPFPAGLSLGEPWRTRASHLPRINLGIVNPAPWSLTFLA